MLTSFATSFASTFAYCFANSVATKCTRCVSRRSALRLLPAASDSRLPSVRLSSKPISKRESDSSKLIYLYDCDGKMLGVKSILEAETLAKKNKLLLTFKSQSGKYPSYQLVDKFSPTKNENPSIECNEMRREKQKRKMKQLVWSPKITDHDFAIKLASAKKWLREGDDVKVCVTGKADKDTFENLFLRFSNSIKSEATIKQKSISATGLKFVCHPIAANISVEKHEKQEDMTTISDTEDPNEIVNKEVESLIQKESSESKT